MSMHIGPPCQAIVKAGDQVKVGQIIGEPTAKVAAPIHASVSGKVKSVKKDVASSGAAVEIVEIESDMLYEVHSSIEAPVVNTKADFIEAVLRSGLVGLGGAGFPTHMKMQPPAGKEPEILLINAAECEPYITTDFRQCIEHTDEVIDGILQVMHYIDIDKAVIGVEDNKPEAIKKLRAEIAARQQDLPKGKEITVRALRTIYPQGAEKMLIYSLTGKAVPSGALPHDVGVMMLNVGTVRYISVYLKTGMPLTRKYVTIDGSAVKDPKNVDVPIGAAIPDVIEAVGGLKEEAAKIIMGGPMMGVAVDKADVSIIKLNNAILVLGQEDAVLPVEGPCIRCARCLTVCPMNLVPTELDSLSRHNNLEGIKEYHILDCIECGSCTFACPAKRHLVQSIRSGKDYVRQQAAKEENIK